MDIVLAGTLDKSICESVVDGEGVRLAVFLAGCPHHCVGCHNPDSWDIKNGMTWTTAALSNYILSHLSEDHAGITFSGGDPLFQEEALREVIELVREKAPKVNIWCYTGYLYEEVRNLPAIKLLDVLVDGPYMKERRTPAKKFRGSNNQRLLRLVDGQITAEQ